MIRKILFISPQLSRSGAPILLLNLAKVLQTTLSVKTDFIVKQSGPLLPDFIKLGEVIVLNQPAKNLLERIRNKFRDKSYLVSKINYAEYDLIISNTIRNADILPIIRKRFKGKIISYIHELETVISYFTDAQSLAEVINNCDLFFAPSLAVKKNLIRTNNISETKIKILPYYIPDFSDSLKKNNAPNDFFIIGGCGTVELRKGTDVFVNVARYFREQYALIPIKFVWMGADFNSMEYKLLKKDISALKLDNTISFLPATENVSNFYQGLDVFLLTSREDPYPLVVLEAANASIPSICFNQSGGAVEFIEGNGRIVDYLDVAGIAKAILYYYNDPEVKLEDGKAANRKLKRLHQNEKAITESFLKIENES